MSNQYFMNQPFWMTKMHYGHPEERGQSSYGQGPATDSYPPQFTPHGPSLPQGMGNDGQYSSSSTASSQPTSDPSYSIGVKVLSQSNKKEFKQ